MATVLWRGDAPAVAQVNTVTPANVLVSNTFTVTINGKAITVTATVATVANVTALLAAAIAASTIPEFLELTATDNTTNVLLTANTAGVPFTQTSSASGGTATNTTATATASAGPNDWSTAANWTGGSIPGSDVVVINNNIPILYGINQSGVTPTSITFGEDFSSDVGLPLYNPNGYYEYRPTRLAIVPSTITTYSQSGRIRMDVGAATVTINGYNTGSPTDSAAFDVTGTGSTMMLNLLKGSYGVALEPSQTASIGTARIGYISNVGGDVVLTLGSGCTTTTVNQEGGTVTMYAGATTLSMIGGTMTTIGAGAFTTMTVQGGATVYHRSTGTITTLNVYPGATADFSLDLRGRTVTNCTVYSGGTLIDPEKTVTFANAFAVFEGSILSLGKSYSLQRS